MPYGSGIAKHMDNGMLILSTNYASDKKDDELSSYWPVKISEAYNKIIRGCAFRNYKSRGHAA